MSEEGKKDGEGTSQTTTTTTDKHPDVVSWSEYVGVKESLGKKLDTEKDKVKSLEEQLGKAVKPEDFNKTKEELDKAKSDLEATRTELTGLKEKSASEKRGILTKSGVPEEKLKGMSDKELDAAIVATQHIKPSPDLGGGSGAPLTGSPRELARQAYGKK